MKVQTIYESLDRIRSLVERNTLPDGTIPTDDKKIEITLEHCETVIRDALKMNAAKTGTYD